MDSQAATLLFVDDETSILSALRRLFRPHGYKILTANGGVEGLEVLSREKVDLVISDMRMPEMDGAQFLERVHDKWPDIVRILLTGYADIASTIAAINRGRIYRYIAKPWDDNEIVLAVRDALEKRWLELENARLNSLTNQQNEELKALNAGLELKVAERTAELQKTLNSLEDAHKALNRSFMTSVRVFSGLLELRGGRLSGHARQVAEHARAITQRMGLPEHDCQDILLAALLHDIGKIGLPDDLLTKPFNLISGKSRADIMKHPVVGQNILMAIDQLNAAAKIVRHHHEYYDGSGYPDQLSGIAIPLGSRILAIVNEYDALQLGTLAQRPLNATEAATFLIENRGKRYDPAITDTFITLLAEKKKETLKELPLQVGQLKPGMVLSRDLNHRDGYLLLAHGHAVNPGIISELKQLEDTEHMHLTLYIRQENP